MSFAVGSVGGARDNLPILTKSFFEVMKMKFMIGSEKSKFYGDEKTAKELKKHIDAIRSLVGNKTCDLSITSSKVEKKYQDLGKDAYSISAYKVNKKGDVVHYKNSVGFYF